MKKLILDNQKINELVNKICRDIHLSGWKPDYVVGLTRGGLVPAVMISHWLDVPMYTLKVSLRDSGDNESNAWMSEDAFGYVEKEDREEIHVLSDISKRKNILIVDDINDTGATLNWIMEDWPSSCCPSAISVWENVWNNNVKFAVIVDNHCSQCYSHMDYTGIEINKAEEDVWIEFPWETWWKQ